MATETVTESGETLPPEDAMPWEKLSTAIRALLGDDGHAVVTLDELRQHEAESGPADGADYYERRFRATVDLLLAKGVIADDELATRMADLAERLAGDKDVQHARARFRNVPPNDIGGLPGGPIDRTEHDDPAWAVLATVIRQRAGEGGAGLVSLHEMRRAVEDLGDEYNRMDYHARRLVGTINILIEKGIVTRAELDRRMADIEARLNAGRE